MHLPTVPPSCLIHVRNAYEPAVLQDPDVRVYFDIFRASTTLAAILSRAPRLVLATNDLAAVRRYQGRGFVLVSEVFDGGYDNSPTQMLAAPLVGADVIHKSTNLTTAIFANGLARAATLVGGFVNASRLIAHIASLGPSSVELVAAAHFAKGKVAVEDLACAEMVAEGLRRGHPAVPARAADITAKLSDLRARKTDIAPHYWDDTALSLKMDALPVLACVLPSSTGADVLEIRALA